MKVLRLTEQEFYFLQKALLTLGQIMDNASWLEAAIRLPDQHYTWPLKRIIKKVAELDKQKKKKEDIKKS